MKTESFQTDHPNPEIARLHRRAHGWDLLAMGWRVLAEEYDDHGSWRHFARKNAQSAASKRDRCLAKARKLGGEM